MDKIVTIPIGPVFHGGPCCGIIHVIEPGDTLYLLGKRYHVSVSSIMYANPFVNVYNLQVGDELCIPTGGPVRPVPRPPKPQPRNREDQNDRADREDWIDRDDRNNGADREDWIDRDDRNDRADREDWNDRADTDNRMDRG